MRRPFMPCTPATGYRQARATHREFVNLIIPVMRFPKDHEYWGPGEYEVHAKKVMNVAFRLPMATYPDRVFAMDSRMHAAAIFNKTRTEAEADDENVDDAVHR